MTSLEASLEEALKREGLAREAEQIARSALQEADARSAAVTSAATAETQLLHNRILQLEKELQAELARAELLQDRVVQQEKELQAGVARTASAEARSKVLLVKDAELEENCIEQGSALAALADQLLVLQATVRDDPSTLAASQYTTPSPHQKGAGKPVVVAKDVHSLVAAADAKTKADAAKLALGPLGTGGSSAEASELATERERALTFELERLTAELHSSKQELRISVAAEDELQAEYLRAQNELLELRSALAERPQAYAVEVAADSTKHTDAGPSRHRGHRQEILEMVKLELSLALERERRQMSREKAAMEVKNERLKREHEIVCMLLGRDRDESSRSQVGAEVSRSAVQCRCAALMHSDADVEQSSERRQGDC